jgi:hypothetical protein
MVKELTECCDTPEGLTFGEFADHRDPQLRLFWSEDAGEVQEADFLAPSHVPSPPFANGLAVILEVRDLGFSSPQANLQVARRLGVHAYFDEA